MAGAAPERQPPTSPTPPAPERPPRSIPAPPVSASSTPLRLLANLYVPRRLRVLFVPMRRHRVVGHIQYPERDRHVHLRHILVIQLRPFVAHPMIVGINVANRERRRGDPRVG